MVDLYCAESLSLTSKHAYPDPVMFSQSAGMDIDEDDSLQTDCLQSLLSIEHVWTPIFNYLDNNFQPDLKPYMRKMVVEWLLEVCKEQHCEDEVFPVTVNLMDRFLAVQRIPKSEFQLLASACFLMASKLRETASLPAEKICKYTENSITLEQLYAYEMFVLDRLQWDLGTVTAHELSDHLIYRLFTDPTSPMFNRLRRHTRALLDLCQTDFAFALQPPSLLAASAIVSSLLHFDFITPFHPEGDNIIYQQVGELVGADAELLAQWSLLLTGLRNQFVAQHQPTTPASSASTSITASPDSGVGASPYTAALLDNSTASLQQQQQQQEHQTGDDSRKRKRQSQQDESSLLSTPVRTSTADNGEESHPRTPTDVADLFDV